MATYNLTYDEIVENLMGAAQGMKNDNDMIIYYDSQVRNDFFIELDGNPYAKDEWFWLEILDKYDNPYSSRVVNMVEGGTLCNFFFATQLDPYPGAVQNIKLPYQGRYRYNIYKYDDRKLRETSLASGYMNVGNGTGIMNYSQFGFDYELGLNNENTGENWCYPAFYLSPNETSIGENSLVTYNFTVTLLDQPKDGLSDRMSIFSDLISWTVAYLQQMDRVLKIDYDSTLSPFDVNYDAKLVGWQFDIAIESAFDCVLSSYASFDGGGTGGFLFSGKNGTSGSSGSSGVDGQTYGTSGTSGVDGLTGESGTDGTSGSSGVDGQTYGTDGTSGSSGVDGTIGENGTDGTSGSSGVDGLTGENGTDGTSGSSGVDGTIGENGTDGTSGSSGVDGTIGENGTDGTSGSSGVDGLTGENGTDGTSGVDGLTGENGTDGTSGSSGVDGTIGENGTDGTSGSSGVDGTIGENGTDGTSGVDGTIGENGTDGTSGSSGVDGTIGENGTDGTSGVDGLTGENRC